jgi:ABC-type antimicrobial peptide transport system permease subunit
MGWIGNLRSGLRSLLGKGRVEREMDEELDGFLDAAATHKRRLGMSAREARRAARVEMGGRNAVKQRVWSSRWESVVENLWQDVRLGMRGLLKSPGFTLVVLLSLTLGIGANTAIFTLMNAIMLRPLPVEKPQQLVLFGDGRAAGSTASFPDDSWRLFSYPFFRTFSSKAQSFAGLAAVNSNQFGSHASVAGGALEPIHIDLVSGSYFGMLGVPALLGRVIGTADDGAPGSGPVAVASYGWFERHFHGDPAALGTVVRVQSHDYTLIGVARPGFFGASVGEAADLWIPLSMEKEISPGWNGITDKLFQSLYIIGRLKPGVSMAAAGSETNLLFKQILRSDFVGANPSQKELTSIQHASIELTPAGHGLSRLRRIFSLPLKILMTIVALVLLIACANIANMLLARGVSRAREVAVQMALGASRGRIVVQLLTESSLLAFAGAGLGIALAWKASPLLLHMATPGPTQVPINLRPDMMVLGFTLLVTVLTALIFGIIPALRATRLELTPALKEGRGGGTASARSTLARGLIVGQIALSILLLAAAGLFIRSLLNLTSIDTGFDKHDALLFSLDASAAGLPHGSPEEIHSVQLQEQIEARVQAIPGVKSDSFAFFTFDEGGWTELAVINQTMARRFFPNGDAVGRRFGLGEDTAHSGDIEVIGVVKDAKYTALSETGQMAAYFPCVDNPGFYGNFVVKTAPGVSRDAVIAQTRSAIAQINPNILISNISSLEEQVSGSIATQSLIAQLSAFFGVLAVFLSCIGIYGLMSYAVLRRTNEIGIRLALGAQTGALLWMVLRESLVLLGLGLAIGLPVTLGSTGILRSQLYQLSPVDPVALCVAVVAVAVMTMLASWLPARRATRVDPMVALRCD